MSRRYEFAMQRQGKGQGKKRNNKPPIKDLDFQTMQLFKDPKESEYEAIWRRDLFSPELLVITWPYVRPSVRAIGIPM